MPVNYATPESPRVEETLDPKEIQELRQAGFTLTGAKIVARRRKRLEMIDQARRRPRPEGLEDRLVDALEELLFLMEEHHDGRTSRGRQRVRMLALANAHKVLEDLRKDKGESGG